MERILLRRLEGWGVRLEANSLRELSRRLLYPFPPPRALVNEARDNLSRAQQKTAFEGEQSELTQLVAELDGLLKKIPSN